MPTRNSGVAQARYAARKLAIPIAINAGVGLIWTPVLAAVFAGFTVAPLALGYPAVKAWDRLERRNPQRAARMRASKAAQFLHACSMEGLREAMQTRGQKTVRTERPPFRRTGLALAALTVVGAIATIATVNAVWIALATAPALPLLVNDGIDSAREVMTLGASKRQSPSSTLRRTRAPERHTVTAKMPEQSIELKGNSVPDRSAPGARSATESSPAIAQHSPRGPKPPQTERAVE